MSELQPMGFRAQIRELLSHEAVAVVPVTENNAARFDAALTYLDIRAKADGDFYNINFQPEETNQEWVKGVEGLWVFGPKEANLADPEQVTGFVNVYGPEHMDEINTMLVAHHKRPYDQGAVLEFASYAKDVPKRMAEEMSAVRQSLAKVFMDEQYKDIRAVSVWVTNEADETVNPQEDQALRSIGATNIGALRYHPSENVDSTCFILPRKAFLDALTASSHTVS